ncbi:MAG: terpene cyclase/mutase family protein [Phycisphaeraceae bacterium]|nr:terpene cyclase/mutase family protein [Phycisphaeraceae bacterium]MCB9847166.1 terpene cyclase/mutase family protein [Phycisphaeraceae bacterium]
MSHSRAIIAAACSAAILAFAAVAQEQGPSPTERPTEGAGATAQNNALIDEITPALNDAVTQGLAALAATQNDDGSFSGGRYGKHVGITALACLAFMADGHIPGRGGYGDNIERGLEFVLQNLNETGLLAAETSHGPMYGHGFATLFVGEVYGMIGSDDTPLARRTHEALVKAVRLIVQTQNNEGGWRYNPVPYDADISVTICQIMALRAARNAGIDVPRDTIDRAVEYVRQCQNIDGGFKYQLTSGGSAWPRSAAGVASLYYAGIYQDDAIDRGLDYLFAEALPGNQVRPGAHYFYGHYYAVQTMYLAGGDRWATWWPAIRDELIDLQNPDGTWSDRHAGSCYGTAMALIILQMPKRYLPIFQK